MDQQDAPTGSSSRTGTVLGAALMALLVVGGFASSVGTGLLLLGLVALIAGAWAVVRGRAGWVHLATRRAGLVVGVAGLAAFVVGAALSPTVSHTSVASSDSARSSDAAPTTEPAPVAAVAIAPPVTTTSAPPSSAAPAPVAPVMGVTCPTGGSNASALFERQISATGPYTVDIDYGDGEHYRNDSQHLAAIFAHTYRVSGNFTVSALLTDAAGQSTSASCIYSWAKPVPVGAAPRTASGSGSSNATGSGGTTSVRTPSLATSPAPSSGGGSSSTGDTYTNVDGNQVHVPVQAPTQPAGATAQCKDGSWSFSQHRSGTCSGHGGVARWL